MFPIRPSRLLPVAVAAALALSGCGDDGGDDDQQLDLAGEETGAPAGPTDEPTDGPTDEPTDEPTDAGSDDDLPGGWTLAETDEFSIGLPPGWFNGHRALNDEDFMAEVAGELDNVTDAELAATIEQGIAGIDLLAFKIDDIDSGFATNINVIAEPRGPFDELDVVREVAPEEMERAGASAIEMDVREVNGLPGVELTYELPEFGNRGIQTYLLADDVVLVVTYSAAEPDPELWLSVLDTIEVAD